MTADARIPKTDMTGVKGGLLKLLIRKKLGHVPDNVEVMWNHPAVQENIAILKKRGYKFVDPDSGFLACGTYAKGRLANPAQIIEEIVRCMS